MFSGSLLHNIEYNGNIRAEKEVIYPVLLLIPSVMKSFVFTGTRGWVGLIHTLNMRMFDLITFEKRLTSRRGKQGSIGLGLVFYTSVYIMHIYSNKLLSFSM